MSTQTKYKYKMQIQKCKNTTTPSLVEVFLSLTCHITHGGYHGTWLSFRETSNHSVGTDGIIHETFKLVISNVVN